MAKVFFHQKRFMKSLRHTHMECVEGQFMYVNIGNDMCGQLYSGSVDLGILF